MDYEEVLKQLRSVGNPVPSARFRVSIPNAREELRKAMTVVLSAIGEPLQWLPEYDEVADWLSDNKGKGLFLYGSCGRGKSLLVRYAIPMLFRGFCQRFVSVVDCGTTQQNIDEILRRKFIALDDIGTEVDRKDFGTLRNVVVEAINKAHDDTGTMLIISSNLSAEAIRDRYGDRILDRIKYLCRRVAFNGKSLRK